MRGLLMVLLWLWADVVQGQFVQGRVTDNTTGEALAFVAVVEQGTTNGAYTDIDGQFRLRLPERGSLIVFNYVGYHSVSIPWGGQDPWEVRLEPQVVTASEVVIRPGENPAERIMRRVIAAKRDNDPERRRSFSYDSYNKLVVTVILDSLPPREDTLPLKSKEKREAEEYFKNQHLFIMESATSRKFMPPDRTEERILANRVSGLRDPMFAMLATQIQSFSFYGETVSILDDLYMSPLADGAIRKYLFILEDTTYIGQDTVYAITFRPRKGKNFQGMRGQLFIHTNGYALQNVIAEPAEPDVKLPVRIQQKYQLTHNGWFPEQLNSFMRFPGMSLEGADVVGISKSYITNLNIDQSYRTREFSPVVLMMERDAGTRPDSIWSKLRVIPLDEKELRTYATVDSVGKAENFDRKAESFAMLLTGKLPIGKVSFDLRRILGYNSFEGFRLGAGVHTNDRFSRRFSVGGYYGYGFKDKGHKGGGDLVVHLLRRRDARITCSWESDVVERGGRQLDIIRGPGLITSDYYNFFLNRMDRREKREVAVSGRLIGNLSANAHLNTQDIRPWPTRYHLSEDATEVVVELNDIALTEAGLTLRWAPGERLVRTRNGEIRLGGKYPVIYGKYSRTIDGLLGGTQSFHRYDVIVEKAFRIVNAGTFRTRIYGGWVPGNLAPSLLYNMHGTNAIDQNGKAFIGIGAPWNFETMRVNEFMHSRYAALHARYELRDLLLKTKRLKPFVSLVHNMLLGDRQGPSHFEHDAGEARRLFVESGLVLDRLLVSSNTSFGLGFFYRYGPNAFPRAKDNFVAKLSLMSML